MLRKTHGNIAPGTQLPSRLPSPPLMATPRTPLDELHAWHTWIHHVANFFKKENYDAFAKKKSDDEDLPALERKCLYAKIELERLTLIGESMGILGTDVQYAAFSERGMDDGEEGYAQNVGWYQDGRGRSIFYDEYGLWRVAREMIIEDIDRTRARYIRLKNGEDC